MKKKLAVVFLLSLILCVIAARAQDGSDVQVNLSFADGKNVFTTGDTIRFKLAFTAAKEGYIVDQHISWLDTTKEEIAISPESGVNHWKHEHLRGLIYSAHVSSIAKLGTEPVYIELSLNDFVRFDNPGKYSLKIKTNRASFGKFGDENRTRFSLTTNQLDFEIAQMSEAEEDEQVRRLSAALDTAGNWQEQTKFAAQLANLTGEPAARELVRRYFLFQSASSGNVMGEVMKGINKSRHRALIFRLFEDAFRDVNREVNHGFINTLSQLRFRIEAANSSDAEFKPRTIHSENEPALERIRTAYLNELIESLPNRTGKSLTTTTIATLQSLPRDNPPAQTLKKLREILLKEFNNLHVLDREYLLRVYWNQLRDPSLTPAIERMLNDNSYDATYRMNVRRTAIERLMEVDKAKARPHVINELRDPQSLIEVDVLSKLDDKFLPEADDALFEQIRSLAGTNQPVVLRAKTLRTARFSTAKHYLGLLDIYKLYADKWWADSRGALLGYLARHNAEEAVPLIEKKLERIDRGHEFNLLIALTQATYSEGVNKILLRRLAGANPETASTAAYLITKHGDKKGAEAVRARLNQWVVEWQDRSADLDSPNADQTLSSQAMFQINMIEGLLNAKSLKLTESQKSEIKQSCLTAKCREHFRIR